MGVLLGFDPGGKGAFGWCVAEDAGALPLACRTSGLADNAREAVREALASVATGESVLAAGIDAPLVWSRSGGRAVDVVIRREIRRAGCPHSSGTVQSVNSLRGACLVEGILGGLELRGHVPSLPLSEAHPKALLWLCDQARGITAPSEHERDALLGAFSAWALVHRPPGWEDLYAVEDSWFSPLSAPLHYFMPMNSSS